MRRNDVILLCIILAVSLALLAALWFWFWKPAEEVVVEVDGEEVLRLPLDEDTEVWIEGYDGGRNLLVIREGEACIREADCPDLVCVHTGKATPLRSVVCAPNRVVVYLSEEN